MNTKRIVVVITLLLLGSLVYLASNCDSGQLTILDQLNELIAIWNEYFETENPSQDLLDTMHARVSDDYLDNGYRKGDDQGKPQVGFKFESISIHRQMKEQALGPTTIDEKGSNVNIQ